MSVRITGSILSDTCGSHGPTAARSGEGSAAWARPRVLALPAAPGRGPPEPRPLSGGVNGIVSVGGF